jgi:hypothetical protein
MKIRLVFQCSRCGSKSFRTSAQRTFTDSILQKIGVTAQRCYLCRRRFYLFRPAILNSLLMALAVPTARAKESRDPVIHSGEPRWWVRQD